MSTDEKLVKVRKTSDYEYGSSKYIYTPLSRLFTRILLKTPATPNQVTIFWGLLMILCSIAFAFGDLLLGVLGGIGWVISYALDYTDGDIARYKDMKSKRGPFQDLVNHRATYPLLMFCIGYGAYNIGRTEFFGIAFDPMWYIILGFLAGIAMVIIMDLGDAYNKVYPEGSIDSDRGSAAVEGGNVGNRRLFKAVMNFNPLVFTNMMLLTPIFALIGLTDVFIIFYGIFYPLAAFGRYVILYRRLPGVSKSQRSEDDAFPVHGTGGTHVSVDAEIASREVEHTAR